MPNIDTIDAQASSASRPSFPIVSPPSQASAPPDGLKHGCREAKVSMSFRDLVKMFHRSYDDIVLESLQRYYKEELPGLAQFQDRDKRMIQYTIKGGQCFRGVLVVAATLELMEKRKADTPSNKRLQQIMCVGWALEILQAAFLVADDIMDESHTRRGKACWHKVDRVHAYNDVFKLEHFAFYVLKRHLEKEEFNAVQDVFRGVILKTTFGQGLDLEYSRLIKHLAVNWDETAVRQALSMESYDKIVAHKTSYYTFNLPLAAALCLAGGDDAMKEAKSDIEGQGRGKGGGEGEKNETSVRRRTRGGAHLCPSDWISQIGLELGRYFQVQDDFLDVYGDPKKTGKIGTDIEQRKLTWLMAKAVEKADKKDVRALFKPAKDYAGNVKSLFQKLELRKEYLEFEENVCAKIRNWVAKAESQLPAQTILLILDKVYSSRKKKEEIVQNGATCCNGNEEK
eukprot:CAMPEP_0184496956 /NCGR_PEP_ID=MMETSP0113_2-20130426/35331_1 /TAXON_ID=91329 /ORGANISM="Norrisiella sphaerica, Strain BC52" /LENGTH=454 /DNA_ID=CAMNT_0026883845 /DNA_START=27 /DNA_END=1391 /DNA_ORIENTATION=+